MPIAQLFGSITGTRQSIQASTIIDGSQPTISPSKKVTCIRLLHRHNGALGHIDVLTDSRRIWFQQFAVSSPFCFAQHKDAKSCLS
jgi:hypothetical protein